MRLVTFSDENPPRLGVLTGTDSVVDLAVAAPELPREMVALVELGAGGGRRAKEAVRVAPEAALLRVSDVTLHAPIPRPRRNVFCVGMNYYDHANEFHGSGFDATSAGQAVPERPIIFTKATTTVIGPGQPIPGYLDPTGSVDYEGELGVVIGKAGRAIRKVDAFDHVYGYTIINDVTSRNLQQGHKQWFLGKSLDGFCPMGPALVTADEVPEVGALQLITRVNGEVRQDARVSSLIFDIPALIKTLSAGMTLEPGDIIATGTPAGVAVGFDPPRFLRAGDRVAITIEPLGTLENPVA